MFPTASKWYVGRGTLYQEVPGGRAHLCGEAPRRPDQQYRVSTDQQGAVQGGQ